VRWLRKTRKRIKGGLGPTQLGIADTLSTILGIAAMFLLTAVTFSLSDLSSTLFWHLAEIGAGLFVAYSVALVGVGPRIGEPERRKWLASSCSLGVLSLGAIALSLVLASLHDGNDSDAVEIAGLSWIAANLLLLGSFIALLPAIAASWRDPAIDDPA
jgi:hypothetical protein